MVEASAEVDLVEAAEAGTEGVVKGVEEVLKVFVAGMEEGGEGLAAELGDFCVLAAGLWKVGVKVPGATAAVEAATRRAAGLMSSAASLVGGGADETQLDAHLKELLALGEGLARLFDSGDEEWREGGMAVVAGGPLDAAVVAGVAGLPGDDSTRQRWRKTLGAAGPRLRETMISATKSSGDLSSLVLSCGVTLRGFAAFFVSTARRAGGDAGLIPNSDAVDLLFSFVDFFARLAGGADWPGRSFIQGCLVEALGEVFGSVGCAGEDIAIWGLIIAKAGVGRFAPLFLSHFETCNVGTFHEKSPWLKGYYSALTRLVCAAAGGAGESTMSEFLRPLARPGLPPSFALRVVRGVVEGLRGSAPTKRFLEEFYVPFFAPVKHEASGSSPSSGFFSLPPTKFLKFASALTRPENYTASTSFPSLSQTSIPPFIDSLHLILPLLPPSKAPQAILSSLTTLDNFLRGGAAALPSPAIQIFSTLSRLLPLLTEPSKAATLLGWLALAPPSVFDALPSEDIDAVLAILAPKAPLISDTALASFLTFATRAICSPGRSGGSSAVYPGLASRAFPLILQRDAPIPKKVLEFFYAVHRCSPDLLARLSQDHPGHFESQRKIFLVFEQATSMGIKALPVNFANKICHSLNLPPL